MKNQHKGWIWMGLGIALLLALFLSPFASNAPDGLERVAETKGFAQKGEGWAFCLYAPLRDYRISWIKNEKVCTGLSGLIGTLGVFLIALGVSKLLKKKGNGGKKSEG